MPRGAKETSLRGGMQHPSQQALFVCLCLHCLTTDMPLASQSVEGLCNEKGLFHGMLGRATTDILGQESDLLTNRAAPAKHPITTFATRCSGCLVTVLRVERSPLDWHRFFFHEYGRRVGMVPRSSLKEGKNSQMVEKKDKDNPTNKQKPQTTGRVSTIL